MLLRLTLTALALTSFAALPVFAAAPLVSLAMLCVWSGDEIDDVDE